MIEASTTASLREFLIYKGLLWSAEKHAADLPTLENINVVVSTPPEGLYMAYVRHTTDSAAKAKFCEAPAYSGGDPLITPNYNRASGQPPAFTAVGDALITDEGIVLQEDTWGADGSKSRPGDLDTYFVLKPGQDYLLLLEIVAGPAVGVIDLQLGRIDGLAFF